MISEPKALSQAVQTKPPFTPSRPTSHELLRLPKSPPTVYMAVTMLYRCESSPIHSGRTDAGSVLDGRHVSESAG